MLKNICINFIFLIERSIRNVVVDIITHNKVSQLRKRGIDVSTFK